MRPRTASVLALATAAALVALTGLAASAGAWWLGEVACSFRWQLGWACAGFSLAATCVRALTRRVRIGTASAGALLALYHLGPQLVLWLPSAREPRSGRELTLATANVFIASTDTSGFVEWVRAQQPAVLGVTEVNSTWRAVCEQLADLYPVRLYYPQDSGIVTADTYGTALLSRLPLARAAVHDHGRLGGFVEAEFVLDVQGAHAREVAGEQALEVTGEQALDVSGERSLDAEGGLALEVNGERSLDVEGELAREAAGGLAREADGELSREADGELSLDGARLHVVMIHPNRPGMGDKWERREALLEHVLDDVVYREHSVLMGDFNTTSYSPRFRALLERSSLRDSRAGFGRQPTFTTKRWIPGLDIDIDHVLVGGAFDVLERRAVAVRGSDHRYLEARLSLAAR